MTCTIPALIAAIFAGWLSFIPGDERYVQQPEYLNERPLDPACAYLHEANGGGRWICPEDSK